MYYGVSRFVGVAYCGHRLLETPVDRGRFPADRSVATASRREDKKEGARECRLQ